MIERLNHEPDEHLADWAHVLYNQAVLTIGAGLEDPAAFVSRLNALLVALGGSPAPDAVDGEPPAGE
jgi:molecular chaperone HtpG